MTFYWKIIFLVSVILWPQLGFTEGDGLPQMDITTFPSQVFWLIITFGILYLFMWRTAVPKLRNTIEERQDKILLDINEAEKIKSEAEKTLREYEEKIQSASKDASEIINQAKTKSDVIIDNIKKQQDLKLSQMLSESKDRINKQYEASKGQIENAKIESIRLISAKFLTKTLDDEEIRKEIN
tara:strand:- start:47 stop:595 length:549 start_codon:yes stop_codon:yes gene_type:complete